MLATESTATDTLGFHRIAPWRPNDYISKAGPGCDHKIISYQAGVWRCDCGDVEHETA